MTLSDKDNEMLPVIWSLRRMADTISEVCECDKKSTSEDPSPSRHKGLRYIKVASYCRSLQIFPRRSTILIISFKVTNVEYKRFVIIF
ncbi:hypothetical protein R1flu_018493 [Riccia fluitans]|uniref:Uncharacterized protein n=1 Tax=Riccia fluitans TaxID=41844 RepID=A0ABD1ZGA6_9MARC